MTVTKSQVFIETSHQRLPLACMLCSELSVQQLVDPSLIQGLLFSLYNVTRAINSTSAGSNATSGRRLLAGRLSDAQVQALLINLATAVSASNNLLLGVMQASTRASGLKPYLRSLSP